MATYECRLLTLNSYHQTEEHGDEVLLKFKKKRVWPEKERFFRANGAQAIKVGYSVPLEELKGTLEFELYEFDNILRSTHLGTFALSPTETGGPFTTDLKLTSREFAKYSLVWEVVRHGPKV